VGAVLLVLTLQFKMENKWTRKREIVGLMPTVRVVVAVTM
jgi:hypothetical protein